jgi:hypothetical protein
MATKRKVAKADGEGESSDEDVVEQKVNTAAGAKVMKKSAGLNYTAICILAMMVVPALLTLGIQAYDMVYPEAATERLIRSRLQRCYSAAKPNEVVDIDKILKKYKKKEGTLFASLSNKYSKIPECQLR